MTRPDESPLLSLRHIGKSFPGIRALADVSLDVRAGKVHALMGENGAGKSTLMRILAGLHRPDSGEVWLAGHPVDIGNPHRARELGIAMIHQELMPFPALSVAENIFAGREPTGPLPGFVDRQRMHREAAALLERVGAPVSPTQMMGKLSVAAMQAVEIAKAISGGARIVIMDEPTSALSSREVDALFRVIASLRQAGVAIVYISHKMDEIFRIADTITVLRDGCHVATQPAAELDERRLIALMVGRELAPDAARDTGATAKASGPAALSVKNLAKESTFAEISFEVHAGEILGVAGLMGAGRTEVMNALYGFDPADTGDVLVRGRRVDIRHPADAIACGMAMVGEDRKDTGLVQELSIKHNVSLAALRLLSPFGFVDAKRENEAADTSIRTYAIRSASRDQSVSGLSGGNQQKVVIARALLTRPSILILDEPTRGIDIGAKQEVYAMVRRLAADGVAIILVSSELPELLALSHRLLVLREGRLVAELNPASTTQEEILSHAMPRE